MSIYKGLRPLFSKIGSRGVHTSNSVFSCEAEIIDGNKISQQVLDEVKTEIDDWTRSGEKRPKLVAILVGENPASKVYVGRKIKAAKAVGIESETLKFDDTISQKELFERIDQLNKDPSVDGIIVQLPVPKQISEREVCQAVIPTKDVDGFHTTNIGSLTLNSRAIVPATALGVKELIVRSKIPTFGKNAVVIGRSKHVGLPIFLLLHSDGKGEISGLDMTTALCHRYTPRVELERYTKLADIVVASAGVPGLVTKEMIKPGACVIDVGISRIKTEEGKFRLVGDVNFDSVKKVAGHITPVPGGVGPMTVAMLMKNTMTAARLRKECEICFGS